MDNSILVVFDSYDHTIGEIKKKLNIKDCRYFTLETDKNFNVHFDGPIEEYSFSEWLGKESAYLRVDSPILILVKSANDTIPSPEQVYSSVEGIVPMTFYNRRKTVVAYLSLGKSEDLIQVFKVGNL